MRVFYVSNFKRATTSDFQQCGILTGVDSVEPVQPPFKLGNSKCCSVSSLTLMDGKGSDQNACMLVAHTTLLEISCHGSNNV